MKLIAHRGKNNHAFQENTWDAFEACLNQEYISGIECDIRWTKDQQLVVCHDMSINRVSDGSGLVENKALKELKKYNFGTKKHPSQILTFLEFIKRLHTSKVIVIELKFEGTNYQKYVDQVIAILKKKTLNYYLCSFNTDVLRYLKEKYSKYPIGVIVTYLMNEHHQDEFDFISLNYHLYSKDDPNARFVWTVNQEKELKKFIKKDLYVVTDKAYLLSHAK